MLSIQLYTVAVVLKVLSIRVPTEVKRRLEELARLEKKSSAEIAREILDEGVRERAIKTVLKMYSERQITLWKAARLAGVSLWELIDKLEEYGIHLQYGLRELEEDLREALGEEGSS